MNKTEPQQWLGRTHFEKCLVGDWGWMVGTLEMSESRKLIVVECHSMNNKKPGKTNDAAILAASHCLLKGSK